MMPTITVRIDADAEAALEALTRTGRSRSEAVREAILDAGRQQRAAQLRAEAEATANDPEDLAEVRRIRAEMDAIGAW